MRYLKQATVAVEADDEHVTATVKTMLDDIDQRGEAAVREYARRFDRWQGDFVLGAAKQQALIARVPDSVKADLRFAHRQISRFALAQKNSLREFEIETEPGVRLGQRVLPVQCAGCYVPGGRYAHAASALMSVATAKAAGVPFIVACSPPRGDGIDPAVAYALDLASADRVLEMGGAQVLELFPQVADDMPNRDVIHAAWRDHGEIILCANREETVQVSDRYACEHLQVLAEDLDWWKTHLNNYGSLFLGEGSTVTHGDKCSGTNHILPTRRTGRYSGGLNVHKFMKVLTYQTLSPEANKVFSAVGSRISRVEGMEGHARACDWRLRKYYPDVNWDFEVYDQKRY